MLSPDLRDRRVDLAAVTPAARAVPQAAAVPRVAVLLATYNGARWLPELLASLAAQEGVAVEVFAADDGSRDNTADVLRAGHPGLQLRVVDGPRTGTPARNFARLLTSLDVAGFDFVAFCDQDDLWLPAKLRRAVDVMTAEGAECYGSDLVAFYEDGRRAVVHKSAAQRRMDHYFQSASAACTYVLRADAARELAGKIRASYATWPDPVSFDCLAYAATRASGWKWALDPAAQILYRQHAANVEGANVGPRAMLLRLRAARRGWIRNNVRSLLPYVPRSPELDAVVRRLERGRLADRLWLAARAGDFRRERFARVALRLCFLLGWI